MRDNYEDNYRIFELAMSYWKKRRCLKFSYTAADDMWVGWECSVSSFALLLGYRILYISTFSSSLA